MTTLRRPVLEEIKDERVREAVQWLYDFLSEQPLLNGQFEHFNLDFDGTLTNEKISHSLGFAPYDIIVTRTTGSGTITFNYDRFDDKFIDITTTGPVSVRFFGGRYEPSNIR
jgi:hypothetical protein